MDSSSQDDRSVKSNQNGTRRQRLTEEQEQQLVQEYLAGDGLKELAARWGFTAGGIWHLLRRLGVPRRSSSEGQKLAFASGKSPENPNYKLTSDQVAEAIRRYTEEKESVNDIAHDLGCSKNNILSYLQRNGIARRTTQATKGRTEKSIQWNILGSVTTRRPNKKDYAHGASNQTRQNSPLAKLVGPKARRSEKTA